MSAYPPPDEILPIFNPLNYEYATDSLTIATADARYLKLTGGTETGLVTFNNGLSSGGSVSIASGTSSLIVSTDVSGTVPQVLLRSSSNNNKQFFMGYDNTNDRSYMVSIQQGSGYKDLFFNNGDTGTKLQVPNFKIINTAASTSSSTGALQCAGGAYFGANSLFGSNLALSSSSILTSANTTASTSSSSGALQIAGGAYFGANSLFGGNLTLSGVGAFMSLQDPASVLFVQGTAASTGSSSGALRCTGGAYFGDNCRMNANLVFQGTASTISMTGTSASFSMSSSTSSMTLAGVLNANGASSQTFSYGFLNSSGITGTGSGTNNYSILAANRIKASEFNAVSSKKIKTVSQSLDDSATMTEAINLFKSIPLSKYTYVDTQQHDSYLHYGLIAENMPNEIYTNTSQSSFCPNIFSIGTINSVDENGIAQITLLNAISEEKKETIINTSNILCYASEDDGKTFTKFEIIQNLTINDATHLTAYLPDYQEYDHTGNSLLVYGSYEVIPNIQKNAYFELVSCVVKNLLARIEALEANI